MNQQELWNAKWRKLTTTSPATQYSKRVYAFLKNKEVTSILDVGCGDGKDSLYFSKKGFCVTSIDFSEEAIQKLTRVIDKKNIKNITVHIADIQHLDIKDTFDVIYANLSLHYFTDKTTTKIFSDLFTLLNTNGYLFVRCKSVDDSLYGVGEEVEKDVFSNKGKIQHLFSKEYLIEKLQEFSIVRVRRTTSQHLTMQKGVVTSCFVEAIAQKN